MSSATGTDFRDPDTEANTEHTPLLSDPSPAPGTEHPEDGTLRSRLRLEVIVLSFVVVFLLELGAGIVVAPTNAIMESIICRHLYPDELPSSTVQDAIRHFAGGVLLVDDPICKSPQVQGELAMLKAWGFTFECIPGFLLAVPYGMLSDKWGRKPVMLLSLLGVILGQMFTDFVFLFSDFIPLWATWFTAAFEIIGGGFPIMVAMLYTVLADVVAVSERSTVFLRLTAAFLTSQMIAGPLGGILMIRDPWVPLLVSLGCFFLAGLAICVLPETLHTHDSKNGNLEEAAGPSTVKLGQKIRAGVGDLSEFILGNPSLCFLMFSLTFVILGRYVGEILLQYATKRYGWSWSDASIVLTIRNAVSLLTLLVVMPVASRLCLQRFGMTGMAKDLWLARLSGIIAVIGCVIIAAAANGSLFSVGLVWFALGSAMIPLIRSLVNNMVEEHHIGTVNTLVGFMETAGLTIAGPVLAKSLGVGLNLGGPWVGLPFFTAASFFAISCTILWTFRLSDGGHLSVNP